MKVRCKVCNGTGGVEPSFGMGCVWPETYTASGTAKICPGCNGTGMQEDWGKYSGSSQNCKDCDAKGCCILKKRKSDDHD